MIYKKLILAVAIAIAAFTPLWAIPDVPILQVDTLVNLSKTGGGEAQSALFLPDGNILAIWKGRPMIIDSKSGETIRNLDALSSGYASDPKITKDGTRLITRVSGPELAIWDIPSGKIIKQFKFQVGWCCISPDGTKMYLTLPNNNDNPGTIAVYDMATFQEIDRLAYPNITWGSQIDISPDGQTLAVSVGKTQDNQYDTKSNRVILINLNDKKNYTIVETFEPQVYSMEFSPDGKQIAFLHGGGNWEDIYIYIYNLGMKKKKLILLNDLSALFGIKIKSLGQPYFVDYNTIIFEATDWPITKNYHLSWNIIENRIKCLIKFTNNYSVDIKDSTLLLCSQGGLLAYLNNNVVQVKDNLSKIENELNFYNNQLMFYSNITFIGETQIFDTTGKLIANLGTQPFVNGKNIIKINQNLLTGIYILTIKNEKEQISKKFIVE
ncbi:MAG: T9SS type A sorting domain-containing protein [bacterium]